MGELFREVLGDAKMPSRAIHTWNKNMDIGIVTVKKRNDCRNLTHPPLKIYNIST